MSMTTQEIMEILPHRHPFLLIDTVEEVEPGVRAVAKKNVTFSLKSHPPDTGSSVLPELPSEAATLFHAPGS